MERNCCFKIFYKEKPKFVVIYGNFLDYHDYNVLKSKIYKQSLKYDFQSIKVTESDKFILELEENDLGINAVWDSDSYNHLYNLIQATNYDIKIKFNIVKVNEYPASKRP